MNHGLDRRAALGRAKAAMAQGDDAHLRYACLELRFCLEALAYAKVQQYQDRLPPDLLAKWQPRILMRALLEWEPDADASRLTRIYRQEPDGSRGDLVLEGLTQPLTFRTVKQHYDRLGNFLHVPVPSASTATSSLSERYQKLRRTLVELVSQLEPIVSSTFSGQMAEVFNFECIGCDRPSVVNAKAASRIGLAYCVHCGAEHRVKVHENGTPEFFLDFLVCRCRRCEAEMQLQVRHLNEGWIFACKACGAQHVVTAHVWEYDIVAERVHDGDTGERPD